MVDGVRMNDIYKGIWILVVGALLIINIMVISAHVSLLRELSEVKLDLGINKGELKQLKGFRDIYMPASPEGVVQ